MKKLADATGKPESLKKLAETYKKTNPNGSITEIRIPDSDLDGITSEITNWQDKQIQQIFLEDIAFSSTLPADIEHIGTAVKSKVMTLGKVQAWKFIYDSQLGDEGYRKSDWALAYLSVLRNHPDKTIGTQLATFVGGDFGIRTLLQKNKFAPCYSCNGNDDPLVKHKYLNSMPNYIADIAYFANNYRTIDAKISVPFNGKARIQEGAIAVINELKSSDYLTVEGAAFVLRVLREEEITNVRAFEMRLNSFTPKVDSRRADLCYEKNGILKIVEAKSYNDKSFIALLKEKGKNQQQFLDYFLNIKNINELEFWFDAKKMPNKQYNYIYELFRELMIGGGLLPALTPTGQAWFDTVWNNADLKNSLWPIPNTLKTRAEEAFANWINMEPDNVNQKLLQFIKIKK